MLMAKNDGYKLMLMATSDVDGYKLMLMATMLMLIIMLKSNVNVNVKKN